jgi:hypothetical protein
MSDSLLTPLAAWSRGNCLTVDTLGQYVVMNDGHLLRILDVSDQDAPIDIGEYDGQTNIYDVCVHGKIAFLATGSATVTVLDVSNPASPLKIGEVAIPYVTDLAIGDTILYAAQIEGGGNITAVDISDPTHPRIRGRIQLPAEWDENLSAKGHFVYSSSEDFGGGLACVDASNPDSLRLTWTSGDELCTIAAVQDSLLIEGTEDSGGCSVGIYKFVRPDSLSFLSRVHIDDAYIRGLGAGPTSLSVLTAKGTAVSIDIANPAAPVIRWRNKFDTSFLFRAGKTRQRGEGLLAALGGGLGIVTFNLSDSLSRTSFLPTFGEAQKIVVRKSLAFIASGFSGLWIMNISDPVHPCPVSNVYVGGFSSDIAVDDTLAYLMNDQSYIIGDTCEGLWIISIADIMHPRVLSHYTGITASGSNSSVPNSLAHWQDLVVVTRSLGSGSDSTLEIVDVKNPAHPERLSVVRSSCVPYCAAVKDSIAYVAGECGLTIYDLHNVRSPREISSIPDFSFGVALKDSFAFALCYASLTVNIANPDLPLVVDSMTIGSGASYLNVAVSGNYIYWASQGLGVVDVSDPFHVAQVEKIDNNVIRAVGAWDDIVVTGPMNDDGGLLILKNSRVTSVSTLRSLILPFKDRLSQNYPNPFNPTTTIQFTIVSAQSGSASGGDRQLTTVKVFDVLGREVATLVNEVKEPGSYTVQFSGSGLASGMYFYRIQAGTFLQTKKLLLLK